MIFQETETSELKRVLNDTLPKEIDAFLNSFDGNIYIGVEDDGTVIGVENLDDVQKRIADIITTQILPNPQEYVTLGTQYVDGKNVVVISVRKGKSLYYIKKYGRSAAGCFIRVGTSCRSMTEEQIEQRYIETLSIPRKTMKEELSPRQDLTFNQFQALLTFKNVHYNKETFEQNYNLRNNDNKFNYIAFLVSDQNDTSIKVVRFNGVTKAEFLSRKEFDNGCIFKQMEDALEYSLNVLNIIQTNIVGKERVDTPYFNAEAFREAWFNAVCHNLWVEKVPPAIYGFDDRVEIISYGLLKDGMTKEEFFMGISNPVNEEFAKLFMQLHYMEQSGKGVPTVVAKYGKEVYHFGTSFIQCIIPYNIIDKQKQKRLLGRNDLDGTINGTINGTIKLSETATIIYELMKRDVKVTKSQLSQSSGKSIRTVSRAIDELKNNGLLLGRTSNKNGEWILKK